VFFDTTFNKKKYRSYLQILQLLKPNLDEMAQQKFGIYVLAFNFAPITEPIFFIFLKKGQIVCTLVCTFCWNIQYYLSTKCGI
jgi:hypothetical protein